MRNETRLNPQKCVFRWRVVAFSRGACMLKHFLISGSCSSWEKAQWKTNRVHQVFRTSRSQWTVKLSVVWFFPFASGFLLHMNNKQFDEAIYFDFPSLCASCPASFSATLSLSVSILSIPSYCWLLTVFFAVRLNSACSIIRWQIENTCTLAAIQ